MWSWEQRDDIEDLTPVLPVFLEEDSPEFFVLYFSSHIKPRPNFKFKNGLSCVLKLC